MGDFGPYGNRVLVTNTSSGFNIHLRQTKRFIYALLRELNIRRTLVSFVFVSDAEMKRLNKRYLNHPWTTDVLAFPFSSIPKTPLTPPLSPEGRGEGEGVRRFLGEIIVSPKRAQVYAKEFAVPFAEELVRYLCHGILHLLGYPDRSVRLRKKMRRAENHLIKLLSPRIKGIV